MTDQPPPGNYPPLPAADYPASQVSDSVSKDAYTPWFTRVLAWLIDYIPTAFLTAIGVIALVTLQKIGENGPSAVAWIIFAVSMLAVLVYNIWNWGYRQGVTGSSVGKQMMRFKVVDESTQQPIGFGKSVLRQIAHTLDSVFCYLGYLLPLITAKRQTIADMALKTVCVPL